MTTSSARRVRLVVIAVAIGGLAFQVLHLGEHAAQVAMWVRHPQRAPWMTPWAMEGSRFLGRVDAARSSETTIVVARGMEYLHLIGNTIFFAGVAALWVLARRYAAARSWSRVAVVIQGAHLAEHVLLVTTLLVAGRPLGVSTGFGAFGGTQLSTYRVWWHGGVNLLATVVCVVAVHAFWRAARRRCVPTVAPVKPVAVARRLSTSTLAVLAIPLVLAFAIGRPGPVSAAHDHGHGGGPDATTQDDGIDGLHFVDVAGSVGLDVTHSAFRWDVTMDPVAMMGGGVCWIDVDDDGWLDLFVTDTWSDGEWGMWNAAGEMPTTRIFRNVEGVFEEYTDEWNAGFEARANGCTAADFDTDGDTDMYVTTARENLLLWNEDGSGFVEGADRAGVDTYGWNTGAAAGDLNGDGLPDLVVAGYADLNNRRPEATTGFPNTFEPVTDTVYVNRGPDDEGHVSFEAVDVGLEPDGPEYGLGVALIDVDLDGDLDLNVANDTQPNRVYLNDPVSPDDHGAGFAFRDVSAGSGADDPNSGMGIATGDVNGDSLPDLVVTNLAGQGHASLSSDGIGADGIPTYSESNDVVRGAGADRTGWGTSFGDLDLDGDLDLLLASGDIPITDLADASEPLTYFCGLDGGSGFEDASGDVGLEVLDDRNGRSVALADYDDDGDLDAVVTSIGQPLALLQNRGTSGQWVAIDPGVPTPGLRVEVELSDGSVVQRQSVSGGTWLSSEDPRIHVGFPTGVTIDRVTVTAPSGETIVDDDVEPGERIEIQDGQFGPGR